MKTLKFEEYKTIKKILNNYNERQGKAFIQLIGYANNHSAKKIKNSFTNSEKEIKVLISKIDSHYESCLYHKETPTFSTQEIFLLSQAFGSEQESLEDISKKRNLFEIDTWDIFDAIKKEQDENAKNYLSFVESMKLSSIVGN
jgi:transcriptional regulatory protein LevR